MEFATTLVGEVLYRSFDNRRQLGSYVGLDAEPVSSGAVVRDQGISKAGNPKARSTHGRARLDVAAPSARQRLEHLVPRARRRAHGRPRRIAIVALARKLLVALWR